MLHIKGRRFAVVNEQLFARKNNWIIPVGPLSQRYRLDHAQRSELLDQLGGMWVQWTDGFGAHAESSEWYAVICQKHFPLASAVSANTRSKLRRGLKNCDVRQVNPYILADEGYETYCCALNNYRNTRGSVPSQEQYRINELQDAPFSDIRHQWGVYFDSKLVGYAHNILYDKTEVDYTLIKLHPDYLKHYTSYALIYKMNEYYLADQGFEYVSDGTRSILHETGVQEFLIQNFGFEKAPMGLHVHYRWPFGHALKIARPFRGIISKAYPPANALFELDRLRCR